MMIDLKYFYLNTPMKRPEYMHLKMNDIPEEIIEQYKLREIATSEGYVYTAPATVSVLQYVSYPRTGVGPPRTLSFLLPLRFTQGKIILSSVISTKGARCMMIDLQDFYLNTPMKRPEYMHLKMNDIPEEIIEQYKLREIATSEG